MTYIYIANGVAARWELHNTARVLLGDEQSLIVAEPDWAAMCREAGGEAALMTALGVVWAEDGRCYLTKPQA